MPPNKVPPKTEVVARRAKMSDLSGLLELLGQLGYPADAEEVRTRLQKIDAEPNNILIVMETDDTVVGFVHAGIRPLLMESACAEICGLVVHENQRGKGLGKMLMAEAEAWAREQGCQMVTLRSNIKRAGAHAFYQGLGYEIYKSQHAFKKLLS